MTPIDRKRNWKPAPKVSEVAQLNGSLPDTEADEDDSQGGYFNMGHTMIRHPLTYRILSFHLCYPLRAMFPMALVLVRDFRVLPKRRFFSYLWEYVSYYSWIKRSKKFKDFRSLRQVMKDQSETPVTESEASMLPLREGR